MTKPTLKRVRASKPKAPGSSGSLAARLRMRDNFFRHRFDARQLFQLLDGLPGVLYFVKDSQSRLMAISAGTVARMGFKSAQEIIGRTVHDYLPRDLADSFLAGDQWVIRHGKPLCNVVEMFFNEQGLRDWIITDKYPLLDQKGAVVGVIGTVQTFESRRRLLAHLGPVGKAADYIRDHLGEPMMLSDVARASGLSERQLQRLFRRVFGMTMQKFIIQSRVQGAIHELTHSQRTIAEIALLFGFSDQSAFTNKIRKTTGLTPRKYRERHVARFIP